LLRPGFPFLEPSARRPEGKVEPVEKGRPEVTSAAVAIDEPVSQARDAAAALGNPPEPAEAGP